MAKRKRKELTLQEKVEVIDFKNKIQRQHCDKLQISFQIQSILRDQQNLLDKFTVGGNTSSNRFQDINLAMLEWFKKARSKKICVSGPNYSRKPVP